MSEQRKLESLIIASLPSGGFVVRGDCRDDFGFRQQLFASTTIDEALGYIRLQLVQP